MIGGRQIEGSKTFNRAVGAKTTGLNNQTVIGMLAALDLGYSAAYPIDDLPKYNQSGERWPKAGMTQKYKMLGIQTLRSR